jgi:di/tricarboxylate transporter
MYNKDMTLVLVAGAAVFAVAALLMIGSRPNFVLREDADTVETDDPSRNELSDIHWTYLFLTSAAFGIAASISVWWMHYKTPQCLPHGGQRHQTSSRHQNRTSSITSAI